MRIITALTLALTVVLSGCSASGQSPQAQAATSAPAKAAPRRRGTATVEVRRPDRFPHRIWAACGFEARTPSYGWFGAEERDNIPKYPGNAHARRATGPYRNFSALMVGMNPVPGPRMGKVNKMYCRYLLKGATQATFQHFSLSSGDNNHIRVSGLTEGTWSEVTLNFTRDARRNDGSPGAFKDGERMDDLKVFVGKPGDGTSYEMIIDDVIFFAEDPALPPEPEPFPNRVIFLAAFDTGVGSQKDLDRFWPGKYELASKPPAGSYWVAVKSVPAPDGKHSHVRLDLKPDRRTGARTKLRFRYFADGASKMRIALHDVTADVDRVVEISDLKKGRWTTQYVDFSKDSRPAKDVSKPLAAGSMVDSLEFVVPGVEGVSLYIDEVVLYDAGERLKK